MRRSSENWLACIWQTPKRRPGGGVPSAQAEREDALRLPDFGTTAVRGNAAELSGAGGERTSDLSPFLSQKAGAAQPGTPAAVYGGRSKGSTLARAAELIPRFGRFRGSFDNPERAWMSTPEVTGYHRRPPTGAGMAHRHWLLNHGLLRPPASASCPRDARSSGLRRPYPSSPHEFESPWP